MKFSIILIVAVLFFASTTTSNTKGFPLTLLARQTIGGGSIPEIPPQCASGCTTLTNLFSSCEDNDSCLCSKSFSGAISSCFDCLAGVDPTTLSELQTSASEFSGACNAAGLPVGTVTITAGARNAAKGLQMDHHGLAMVMGVLGAVW
ncbi:hypothetical protein K439DRAFT_1137533 [Ramaria rubella]|nr:hypothetical protein K439DRAFT_1137533 [Ramaria rubella]